MELFDIRVKTEDYEETYRFVFSLSDQVKVGATLNKGDVIGIMMGAEVDIASVESFMDGDIHGSVVMNSLTSSKTEEEMRPDHITTTESVYRSLYGIIDSLSPLEQFIVFNRIFVKKPKPRSEIAKILNLSVNKVSSLEDDVKRKIRQKVDESGLTENDF